MPESEPKLRISVIIPCFNEEKNLRTNILNEVTDYLSLLPYPWEIIIVNDGSTDNSRTLIQNFTKNTPSISFIEIPHRGKPWAVWAGIQSARGDILLLTDMDQSTPIQELENLLPWFEKGYDMVIGSRGTIRQGFTLLRKTGSIIFKLLRRLFLLRNINDTQCGFKACRRDAALEIFPHLQYYKQEKKPKGWRVSAYDVELLYLFQKAGHPIKEIVVNWCDRDESDTKCHSTNLHRYVNETIEMAHEVLRVVINQIKGLYDEI